MTLESFAAVVNDERISQILICDDHSDEQIFADLVKAVSEVKHVEIYRNKENLDCYRNKRRAVELSKNEFTIIFDSDNIIDSKYIDRLYDIGAWDKHTAYMPVWAAPTFSYRSFSGLTITKENINTYLDRPFFSTMINCANYFINRDEYLKVWDGSINPHTADSIFQNYNWFAAGNKMYVVPGLVYQHRIHPGSHYVNNNHKTGSFYQEVENKIRALR